MKTYFAIDNRDKSLKLIQHFLLFQSYLKKDENLYQIYCKFQIIID